MSFFEDITNILIAKTGSNHGNKAGVRKVICEEKSIKSAFKLILQ
jgi:hypothetical protein